MKLQISRESDPLGLININQIIADRTYPRLLTEILYWKVLETTDECGLIQTITSCHWLNARGNKMKVSIKFFRRKILNGKKSVTKNYINSNFCSCSKLLWAQCKKDLVQLIVTQVCSITSGKKLKVFFSRNFALLLVSMLSFAS